MGHRSLGQKIGDIESILDPTSRYVDLAVILDVYDTVDGELTKIDESPMYGGRWDLWHSRYADEGPEEIVRLSVSTRQWKLIQSGSTKKLVKAGRGGGKTHGLCCLLLVTALQLPNGVGLSVSPTFPLSDIIWSKLLNDLPTVQWLRPGREGVQLARRQLVFKNGFRLKLLSAKREESLRAGDADIVVVDERQDISQKKISVVFFQLRKRSGVRFVQVGTPDLSSDFTDELERYERDEEAFVSTFTSYDNPFIPHDVFEDAKQSMDTMLYRQEVLGEIVSLKGLVYWNFDRQIHVKPYPQIAKDVTRTETLKRFGHAYDYVIGADYNIEPYMAVTVFKIVAGGIAWVVDEIAIERWSAEELVRQLRSRGYRSGLICDDASGQFSIGGHSTQRYLREQGFRVTHGRQNPRVVDRVASVTARLMSAQGEPHLFVDPKCHRLVKAFCAQTYRDGKPDKTTGHDHILDSMGYVVHTFWPSTRMKEALKVA